MQKQKISIFWFRRDLRLSDNHGLSQALNGDFPVLPIFIFDQNITDELPKDDARISFIYKQIISISDKLKEFSSSIYCHKGNLSEVWQYLMETFDIQKVYANEDYEPYAIQRDLEIDCLLSKNNIQLKLHKDQVIFGKNEVLKNDNTPYTVFTPYKNKWIAKLELEEVQQYNSLSSDNYLKTELKPPSIEELGFTLSSIKVIDYRIEDLQNYEEERNFPALNQTSRLSPHLRFGTVSIREVLAKTKSNRSFLSELIWREFFMQILFHFPEVVHQNFKRKYDSITWRNNLSEFEKWKNGETGYPMVDAGMRELNATGYMHNRVRMVVAGFLCKHLLIDWRWGEAYFATKLLDYELAANNGNWQWSAGTGCDAAPYFRVFNPTEQIKKFDPKLIYIKKWISELNSFEYSTPMVDHKKSKRTSFRNL